MKKTFTMVFKYIFSLTWKIQDACTHLWQVERVHFWWDHLCVRLGNAASVWASYHSKFKLTKHTFNTSATDRHLNMKHSNKPVSLTSKYSLNSFDWQEVKFCFFFVQLSHMSVTSKITSSERICTLPAHFNITPLCQPCAALRVVIVPGGEPWDSPCDQAVREMV